MKISELIKKLQEIQKEKGNIIVYRVYDDGESYPMNEDNIELCIGCVEIY